MNWKDRIRNLRLPRLLIEAALIFGSVYMALILEADRSRDFERDMLSRELQKGIDILDTDTFYFTNFAGGKYSDSRWVIPKAAYFDSLAFHSLKLGNKEIQQKVYGWYVNDSIVIGVDENIFSDPPILSKILNENSFLIQDDSLVVELQWYFSFRRYVQNLTAEKNQLKDNLYLHFNSKISFDPTNASEEERKILLESKTLRNALLYSWDLSKTIKDYSKRILKKNKALKNKFENEIQAQKKAMKGIF